MLSVGLSTVLMIDLCHGWNGDRRPPCRLSLDLGRRAEVMMTGLGYANGESSGGSTYFCLLGAAGPGLGWGRAHGRGANRVQPPRLRRESQMRRAHCGAGLWFECAQQQFRDGGLLGGRYQKQYLGVRRLAHLRYPHQPGWLPNQWRGG